MYMFNGKTNDGFYDMGLAVVGGIGERVEEEGVVKGASSTDFDMNEKVEQGDEVDMGDEKKSSGGIGETIPGLEEEKGIWDK